MNAWAIRRRRKQAGSRVTQQPNLGVKSKSLEIELRHIKGVLRSLVHIKKLGFCPVVGSAIDHVERNPNKGEAEWQTAAFRKLQHRMTRAREPRRKKAISQGELPPTPIKKAQIGPTA